MRCKDCIWWNEEHILLDDGTTRAYTEEEKRLPFGVTSDVGINVGATCRRYPYIENFWMGADDYCSHFEERTEEHD